MKLISWIQFNVFEADERGKQILLNILNSLVIKGGSIMISLLILPLTINYVSSLQYGIWITISSVLNWLNFFDIGLGNGLRNKYVEAVALNDYTLAKKLVSTTYALVALIALALCIIFFIINGFLDYSKLFNTPLAFADELKLLFPILFVFFNIQLILSLINSVLIADHKISKASLINFLGALIGFIAIYILSETVSGSLFILGLTLSGSPLIVLVLANWFLFKRSYKTVAPSWSYIEFNYSKSLLKLGGSFFIIQIAVLVIFSSSNFLIAHLLGPLEVTKYNIAYKYFSVFILLFNIVLGPYWSVFTEAYIKKEFTWIKNTVSKLIKVWVLVVVGILMMLFLSPFIYPLWIGSSIHIDFNLSVAVCLFVIVSAWNSIFGYFLNAVGKIKLQLFLSAFISVINIPLAIFFVKYFEVGTVGIIMATTSCLFISSVIAPMQYYKIISNQAFGIWNK
jgi:O-antigen/teichoic acid export membrane protein